MTKPIEGWVAWHPVEGGSLGTASISKQFCENKLLKNHFNFDSGSDVFAKADAYYAARDIELNRAASDNWRVRPVRITFTDEPKSDIGVVRVRYTGDSIEDSVGEVVGCSWENTADAIKKERERIYTGICRQINNCDRLHPQMALDVIFGEEK